MADDGKPKLAWRAFPTWDRSPGLRPETVIVAALWGAFLIGMAYLVGVFDDMLDDMVIELGVPLPLVTRVVFGTPAVAWILLGVLVPVALIWRLRRASARAADMAEHVAFVALFAFAMFVSWALLRPIMGVLYEVP